MGVERRINAIVRTFLRDEHMKKCVQSIEDCYPGIQIVLVDDGYSTPTKDKFYAGMRNRGHIVETQALPFDSGFGAKGNYAAALCTREYILTVNDDFFFTGDTDGVRKMGYLLDALPDEVGLVCGTWMNRDYQGWLKRTPGRVEEIPFDKDTGEYLVMDRQVSGTLESIRYQYLDICAVYGIFRRAVFTSGVRWDGRYKIGGEHGDWFMDIADAGWKIAFTPEANINQIVTAPHPDYDKFRMRQDWKKHYVAKHGPHVYKYFDGREDRF